MNLPSSFHSPLYIAGFSLLIMVRSQQSGYGHLAQLIGKNTLGHFPHWLSWLCDQSASFSVGIVFLAIPSLQSSIEILLN